MATNDNMDTNAGAGCEDDRKLFAGGLPQDAKEAQIKEHFGQFGEIETVTLKTNMATGRSRGFCFIVYKSVDSLEAAVAAEHTISNKKAAQTVQRMFGELLLQILMFIYDFSINFPF